MAALGQHGFPVPDALDQNRHAVLMSLVPGVPLVQVGPNPSYSRCPDAQDPCKFNVQTSIPRVHGAPAFVNNGLSRLFPPGWEEMKI